MNPQSVYNGFVSNQRNMFLSSSLAVVIIGFSNKFKNKLVRVLIKFMSLIVFGISMFIGLKANYELNHFLDNNEVSDKIPVESWKATCHVTYLYVFVLFITSIAFLLNRSYL